MFKKIFKQVWAECFELYKSGIIDLGMPLWNWLKNLPAMIIKALFLIISLTLGAVLMLIIAPFFITVKRIIF
jgi:type IV secretory pathway VirB6-like protein